MASPPTRPLESPAASWASAPLPSAAALRGKSPTARLEGRERGVLLAPPSAAPSNHPRYLEEYSARVARPYEVAENRDQRSSATSSRERLAPFLAEFVGTFLFVFTVSVSTLFGEKTWHGVAAGVVFAALLYSLSPISGGHLNPAVSVACGLAGKAPWLRVVSFILLQLFASFLASALTSTAFADMRHYESPEHLPMSTGGTVAVEMFFSTLLCFVFLSCATSPSSDFFGLAVGLVIIGGASCSSSGFYLNPALSLLSPSVLGWDEGASRCLYGACGEVLGSILAAILHYWFRARRGTEPRLATKLCVEFFGSFALALTFWHRARDLRDN